MITLKLCGDVYDCRCHQRLLEDCGKSGGLFRVEVGGGVDSCTKFWLAGLLLR